MKFMLRIFTNKPLTRFFIGLTCLTQMVSASEPSYQQAKASSLHLLKNKIGSDQWIEQKVRQYPELLWLAEPSSSANFLSSPQGTVFSQNLFDKQVPAFDLAIRSIMYLHLLIQGSRQAYTQFEQLQPGESEISFKQFQTLHKQLTLFLNSPKNFDDTLKILETAIVLKHLGASSKATQVFKPYFSDAQLSSFYAKSLQVLRIFPELCPSFAHLSSEQKETLFALRRLADYQDLLDLKAVPNAQLLSMGRSKRALIILDMYLFSLDTAGESNYSQELFQHFQPLLSMLQKHATVEEAFSRYFTYRANRLGFEGITRSDMTLTRLATLMKLSPMEASALSWGFKNLPVDEAEVLVNNFYTTQGDHISLTILGLPELTAGLLQATYNGAASSENKLRQVYSTALSLIVKSLRAHKEMLNKQILPEQIILDFSDTTTSCGGIDLFSENIAVRIHLDGNVSVSL